MHYITIFRFQQARERPPEVSEQHGEESPTAELNPGKFGETLHLVHGDTGLYAGLSVRHVSRCTQQPWGIRKSR